MRTVNNKRERSDGGERYSSTKVAIFERDDLKLVNPKEFEWLAWNYRAFINTVMFISRRNMVF